MRKQHSRLLAHGTVLALLLFASCDDHDEAVGDRKNSSAGTAGVCAVSCAGDDAGGANGSAAGETSAGEGGTPLAAAGKPAVGGSSGSAGTTSTAGTSSTLGGESGNAGEGPVGPVMEELSLCERLSGTSLLTTEVSWALESLVINDCRVDWLTHLYLDFKPNKRDQYMNALRPWNLRFWGCQDQPVADFPLVFGTPPLSQGDADLLVDYYVQAAIAKIGLSSKEEDEMRSALARLAAQLVVDASSEPSQSTCGDPNAGGAGGATSGGAGGETGGGAGLGGGELQ
jgi:hypothetical protein